MSSDHLFRVLVEGSFVLFVLGDDGFTGSVTDFLVLVAGKVDEAVVQGFHLFFISCADHVDSF